MKARLVGWIDGSGRLDRELTAETRVGATSDNDIVVRVDGVSRLHATIKAESGDFWIEDSRSRNGTWVNGERAARSPLRHLDVITLGRFAELVFIAREGETPAAAPAPSVAIEWVNGPAAGQRIDIAHGETIFGRAESCGVVVNDGSVSRAHARLTHSGDSVSIEDLGSVNGTMVNGQPLESAVVLEPGALVDLGDRQFRILIEGVRARPSAALQGATPTAAQDVEWMTRLVWSESDVEAVRAAVASGGAAKPAPPQVRAPEPAPVAPSASAPPPAVVSGATSSSDPGVVALPGTPSGETLAGVGPFEKLPVPTPTESGAMRTIAGGPGTFAVPDFAGSPPTDAPTAFDARTEEADAPTVLPTSLEGAEAPQARRAPEFTGRTSIGRSDLPASTVLGYRDVGPATRPASTPGVEPPPGAVPPAAAAGPLRGMRLTGPTGAFELSLGSATIGRSEQAIVRIDSRDVSRIHAVLIVSEHQVVLEDRGSVNGTTLNGIRVKGSRPVSHGDRVAFADFEFLIELLRTEATP